jgi:hypothetical protein
MNVMLGYIQSEIKMKRNKDEEMTREEKIIHRVRIFEKTEQNMNMALIERMKHEE